MTLELDQESFCATFDSAIDFFECRQATILQDDFPSALVFIEALAHLDHGIQQYINVYAV